MKYFVSSLVGAVVYYLYAARHPYSGSQLPLWVEALSEVLVWVLPLSLACRLVTKKIKGLRARVVDLTILLFAAGIYWAMSTSLHHGGLMLRSPLGLWVGLTSTTWFSVFFPFGVTVMLFEWFESLRGKTPNQTPLPTPVSVTPAAGAPVAPDTGAAEL